MGGNYAQLGAAMFSQGQLYSVRGSYTQGQLYSVKDSYSQSWSTKLGLSYADENIHERSRTAGPCPFSF